MRYIPIQRVQWIRETTLKIESKHVDCSEVAIAIIKEFFKWLSSPQENFVVMTLNTQKVVTGILVITTGTLDCSLIHPREVFRYALLQGANSIILAHNHPSGDSSPSREDQAITRTLIAVGKTIGIPVLDHIIYGNTCYSFVRNGLLT